MTSQHPIHRSSANPRLKWAVTCVEIGFDPYVRYGISTPVEGLAVHGLGLDLDPAPGVPTSL